jgi:hypothetical protein
MPDTVHVPLLGNMNRGVVLMGGIAAVGVTGYVLYRNSKKKAAAVSTGGAYAYGYGQGMPSGYYGYGYGYGGFGGGSYAPYPQGAEYGYGAYGYGYYNPYTGQWIGPTGSGVAGPPGPTGPTGPQGKPGTGGGGPEPTHIITANGKLTLAATSRANKITEFELLAWNPNLMHLYGSKKPIPRGTRVLV